MANVPGAIYRVTFEDGLSLRLIGDEIERITGYPPEDFVDAATRTLFSIVHPDDRGWVERDLRAVREHATDDLAAGATARRSLTIEYRIVRADGEVRWVLERGTTVRDQDGRVCLDGADLRRHRAPRGRGAPAPARGRGGPGPRAAGVAVAHRRGRRRRPPPPRARPPRRRPAAFRLRRADGPARAARGPAEAPEIAAVLQDVAREIEYGLSDLRELAHGIHPAVLSDRGLPAGARVAGGALAAARSTLEGGLASGRSRRSRRRSYFAAAEALQNVTKYAERGRAVTIALGETRGEITIAVRDDGRGGASLERGSGLRGLVDRLGAVGGRLELESPPAAARRCARSSRATAVRRRRTPARAGRASRRAAPCGRSTRRGRGRARRGGRGARGAAPACARAREQRLHGRGPAELVGQRSPTPGAVALAAASSTRRPRAAAAPSRSPAATVVANPARRSGRRARRPRRATHGRPAHR